MIIQTTFLLEFITSVFLFFLIWQLFIYIQKKTHPLKKYLTLYRNCKISLDEYQSISREIVNEIKVLQSKSLTLFAYWEEKNDNFELTEKSKIFKGLTTNPKGLKIVEKHAFFEKLLTTYNSKSQSQLNDKDKKKLSEFNQQLKMKYNKKEL